MSGKHWKCSNNYNSKENSFLKFRVPRWGSEGFYFKNFKMLNSADPIHGTATTAWVTSPLRSRETIRCLSFEMPKPNLILGAISGFHGHLYKGESHFASHSLFKCGKCIGNVCPAGRLLCGECWIKLPFSSFLTHFLIKFTQWEASYGN